MLVETRGNDGIKPSSVSFSEAILEPSASFGGLYAPSSLPAIDSDQKGHLKALTYGEFSKEIFSLLGLEVSSSALREALALYGHFDDPHAPAPIKKIYDNLYIQELYHGPTRAFKDMALQPFGHLLSTLAKERGEKYLILTATSGDTGPATLTSFANQENIQVLCLYPDGGTSDVQRLQMTTQEAKNLKVVGIEGDFDDAQRALKSLLQDEEFKEELERKKIRLSAANSVNFGRIAFQIIYHAYASLRLDSPVDIIVPSGNFGNALGAFYAKMLGFPIQRICITSNANDVLSSLINEGIYDIRHRSLEKTLSPAMDILKSSNVERLLFALFGAPRTKELMESLDNTSYYQLTQKEHAAITEHFMALSCSDTEALENIKKCADAHRYLMDPHTATGIKAYQFLKSEANPKLLCSTAEWTKFAPTLALALSGKHCSDKEALEMVSRAFDYPLPEAILSLFHKAERHTQVVQKETIKEEVLRWIG